MSVSLRELVTRGVLVPGPGVLRTVYKGVAYDADLGPSGVIHFQGHFFEMPSAFSLFTKRLTQPERKADDGWRSVTYQGCTLHDLKMRIAPTGAAGPAVPGGAVVEAAPKGGTKHNNKAKAAAPATDARGEGTLRDGVASAPSGDAAVASPPPPGDPARLETSQYARNRPQRERLPPQRLVPGGDAMGPNADLRLVHASVYGASSPCPFRVEVHPAALLLMDAHAHLCTAEVIGFLGGSYDASTRTLTLARALPARQLVARDAAVEVELDPEGMPAILEACEADGLSVVGWYHSHPVFATQPSVRDVANQGAYQRLFDGTPFIGAIVGPYAAPSGAHPDARCDDAHASGAGRRPDWVSELRLFHVEPHASALGGGWPRQLEWCALPCRVTCPPDAEAAHRVRPPATAHLLTDLRAAAEQCAQSLLRVDFASAWPAAGGGKGDNGIATKRDKLRACLLSRLETWAPLFPEGGVEELVDSCVAVIDDEWRRAFG